MIPVLTQNTSMNILLSENKVFGMRCVYSHRLLEVVSLCLFSCSRPLRVEQLETTRFEVQRATLRHAAEERRRTDMEAEMLRVSSSLCDASTWCHSEFSAKGCCHIGPKFGTQHEYEHIGRMVCIFSCFNQHMSSPISGYRCFWIYLFATTEVFRSFLLDDLKSLVCSK